MNEKLKKTSIKVLKWLVSGLAMAAITAYVFPGIGKEVLSVVNKIFTRQEVIQENQEEIMRAEYGDNKYEEKKFRKKLEELDKKSIEELVSGITLMDDVSKKFIVKQFKNKKYEIIRQTLNNFLKDNFEKLNYQELKTIQDVKYKINFLSNFKSSFIGPNGLSVLAVKVNNQLWKQSIENIIIGDEIKFNLHIYANKKDLKNGKLNLGNLTDTIINGSKNIIAYIKADNINREYDVVTIKSNHKVKLIFNRSSLQINKCQDRSCAVAKDYKAEYTASELYKNEWLNAVFVYDVVSVDEDK